MTYLFIYLFFSDKRREETPGRNRLPEDIRAEPDITNFRKRLKTHYFNSMFNVL